MTTALAHRSFVALTPTDVPAAQAGIADWCREKIITLGQELREQRQNLAEAKRMLWRHHGWTTAITKTKARMIYYAKIRAAVRAGYLIVPNFECEVMAVRVKRDKPREKDEHQTVSSYGRNEPSASLTRATPELLPPGLGRYVDDELFYKTNSYADTDREGKPIRRLRYTTTGYDVPDFPVLAVKPEVMDATGRAMALRIFDRIGVVTGRKQDPLVIGELIDPGANLAAWPNQQKRVSFFIAWWLNTEDL